MTANKDKDKKQTTKKTAVQKKKTTTKKSVTKQAAKKKEKKEDTGFFVETAENIETGAKVVAEKASEVTSDLAEKTSEVAGTVLEKAKEIVSDAVDLGTKAMDEVSQSAQTYIDKYKNKLEMKNASEERNALTTKLGSIIYVRLKVRDIGLEHTFKDQEILAVIKDIEKKDREIVKIGKKIDKNNK